MSTSEISAAYYKGNKAFKVEKIMAAGPQANEVQIEVAYCGICGTDLHAFHGSMDARIGLNRIIGHEMSGVIAAVGDEVTDLKVGQHVVVRPLDHCGDCPACNAGHIHICHNLKFLGLDTDGAFQQLWSVPAHTVHVLPDSLSLAHAALVEPVSVACHDVRRSRVQPGEDVLVIGGGPIGMLVGMVAQQAGGKVVISEVSPARLAIAKKLGFETINPREETLGERIMEITADKGADVIFEVSGTQAGVDAMTDAAACRARIVMVAIHAQKPVVDMFRFFWRELELLGARVYAPEDYEKAIELVTSGGIDAETMITHIGTLETIQSSFEALENNPTAMKSLIKLKAD
jgi:2-desacetyl-2-hydroxyethyl bacteriochlorophyllide A dehydrogenase